MAERAKSPIIPDEEPESTRGADKIEEFSFDDLDKEVGLGDMLKEKDNVVLVLVKKITFALIVLIVSVIVFFASFTIGKLMFLTDSTPSTPSYESSEMSPVPTEVAPSENVTLTENVVTVPAQAPVPSPQIVAVVPATRVSTVVQTKITPKEVIKPAVKAELKPVVRDASAKVVVPEKKQEAKTEAVTGTPSYTLVAGTFAKRENAQLIVDSLNKLSYKPQIIEITKNNVTYFRVLAGSYASLAEVRAKVLSLKAKGIESFPVPYSVP